LVAELVEIVRQVEGAVAFIHQWLIFLNILQLFLEINLRVNHTLCFIKCIKEELVRILIDIALSKVFNHVIFDFVDEPDVMLYLYFRGGKQHLHNCFSIVLQQDCLVGLREKAHAERLRLKPVKDVLCVLLIDGSQGRFNFSIGSTFQGYFRQLLELTRVLLRDDIRVSAQYLSNPCICS
jgi:hypothetical protein